MWGAKTEMLLVIEIRHLLWMIYLFLGILTLLFIFILSLVVLKKKAARNASRRNGSLDEIIDAAIFDEALEIEKFEKDEEIQRLLKTEPSRQQLIDKMLHARKNLSGISCDNIRTVYNILQLEVDSLTKLKQKKWHIKAKGIHELSIMDQRKHVLKIYRLINDKNELVRSEAQCALVKFYGFKGLRFLNITNYAVSNFQQIQLLNMLKGTQVTRPGLFDQLLQSANKSVVTFAIKLANYYHAFHLQDKVMPFLGNPTLEIQLQAVRFFTKFPSDAAMDDMMVHYQTGEKEFRLAILNSLKENGGDLHLSFLMHQLHDEDNMIKLAAAKALAAVHPEGSAAFTGLHSSGIYPWTEIFHQVKNELAA